MKVSLAMRGSMRKYCELLLSEEAVLISTSTRRVVVILCMVKHAYVKKRHAWREAERQRCSLEEDGLALKPCAHVYQNIV